MASIKEINNTNKNLVKETFNKNKEKTFEKISKLQRLIKKESALKELCKKNIFNFNFLVIQTLQNNKNKIIKGYEEIFNIKIDVENMISERIQKDEYKYKLVTDPEQHNKILGNINIYVPDFMHQLWKNPKSIATILLKADRNDIKKNLGHFITHNLYDNITSLNHKDEQLLYIITLLLKEEIKSLTTINNSFFSDKRCGIILEELNKKKEVKSFFKVIILEIIKKLENIYSTEDILFNPKQIKKKLEDDLKNEKGKKEDDSNEVKNIEKKEFKKSNCISEVFDEEKLNEKLLKCKDKEMKDFLKKIISNFKTSPNKYINDTLKTQIYNEEKENINDIVNYYNNSFRQVIDIIDMLFDNLLKNCDLLPYSIKCICKVISILINKKFPNSIKVEQNKVLVNFFFHTLLFPILLNPSFEILINEVIITNSTIEKMQFIFLTILNNITLGNLFEQNIFTPFNLYIIEKMPKLIEFLNNICQATLPPFINKLINDELPENYEYDYFKENPDEDILYRNICYNIDELNSLITNAEKFKDEITIDKKILSKFQFNKKKLQNLRRSIQLEELKQGTIINKNTNQKKIINCFLLTDSIINNEKLGKLLNIDNDKTKKHFTLKELKIIQTDEDKKKNNIIKVKNFFYSLLYNYPTLSKYNYKEEQLYSIINILNELKIHSYTNSSIYMDKNYIPSNWYINSLIQYLPKLPENLRKNDYEELLNELEKEITNSITELKLDELSIYIEYFKEIEKEKIYLKNLKNIIIDIDLNKKVQEIVQTEQISLNTKTEDKNISQFFKNIRKDKKYKDFRNLFYKEKKNIYSNTIQYFINNFPNVSNVGLNYQFDIYHLIEEKKIPEIIENYMYLVKNCLKAKNIDNEKNLEEIYNKIYDYIMEKLYNKLFPKEPEIIDNNIFQSCYKHMWIEFRNLIKEKKNYIFDNYLPDTINYFNQFIIEKSPRKKLLCIKEIFDCIYNLGKFNGKEVDGTDDEMPLLNYAFIKSNTNNIYSNCKYTELFLGTKKYGIEGSQLTKILGICDKMLNITYEKDIFNISEEEYNQNCNLTKKIN